MRKRLLMLAVVTAFIASAAIAMLYTRARQERLAKLTRSHLISREQSSCITTGMSERQVEALLGGVPGDFRIHKVEYSYTCPLPLDFKGVDGGRWRSWTGDEGRIEVLFDGQGTVQFVWFATGIRSPSLLEHVLDWLLSSPCSGK